MATLLKRMFAIALIGVSSCNNSDKNSSLIFEELNESLERSNKSIQGNTQTVFNDLGSKRNKPESAEKANFWFPKMDSVSNKSKSLIYMLDSLRDGMRIKNTQLSEETFDKVNAKLKDFKEYVLYCDPLIKLEFEKEAAFLDKDYVSKKIFSEMDSLQKRAALTKIINDIRYLENRVVTFCNYQSVPFCGFGMTKTSVIITCNSKKFGFGDELIIQAGIAEFSIVNKPTFIINGDAVSPGENGIGQYKLKVGNKAGKFKVPVKINYVSSDGRRESFVDDIEYRVLQ
jgi:hypothetical protein